MFGTGTTSFAADDWNGTRVGALGITVCCAIGVWGKPGLHWDTSYGSGGTRYTAVRAAPVTSRIAPIASRTVFPMLRAIAFPVSLAANQFPLEEMGHSTLRFPYADAPVNIFYSCEAD